MQCIKIMEKCISSFDTNWVIENIEPGKQYTISYNIEGVSVPEYDSKWSGNLGFYLYSLNSDKSTYTGVYLMDGNGYYIDVGEKYSYKKTFIAPSNVGLLEAKYVLYTYTNRYIKDGKGVYSSIILSNLQLEEGAEATEYEPYILEETTPITQNKNHTLTAIWEKL